MTDSGNDIETRVTILERGYAELREENALAKSDAAAGRMLAADADHDVSEVRAELRSHTRALNALRETQLEQGRRISVLEQKMTGLEQKMTGLEHMVTGLDHMVTGLDQQVTGLDQKVTEGFAMLATGMGQITAMLSGNADSGQN